MKVVFMGTPDFAVGVLSAIIEAGFEVAAVVTAPDKPAGRGLKMQYSAVKAFALERQLPLLQPKKLKSEDFVQALQQLQADVFVVVAFRMLPEVVYAMPPKGTFNVHASLLPQYRGAAPIHHAIINGETKTGVTTFFLDKQIDTGDIIDAMELPIGADETVGELYDRLMVAGAQLAVRTLQSIEAGTVVTIPQPVVPQEDLKPAPKIFKEDTFVDWTMSTVQVYNHIRGLSPSPCACTRIKNHRGETELLKLYKVRPLEAASTLPVGTLEVKHPDTLIVHTADGQIQVENLQLQGKKRLSASEFLRGFRPENYTLSLF